jgi:integrase
MGNIIFKIDKPRNTHSSIMMVYRFDGEKLVISTKISIPTDVFDNKSQRINKKHFHKDWNYEGYNRALDHHELALRKAISYFRNQNLMPSYLELKERFLLEYGGQSDANTTSNVVDFLTEFIDKEKEKGSPSFQNFVQLKQMLTKFPNGRKLEFKDLQFKRLKEFTDWMKELKSKETGKFYSRSYLAKICKKLTTIISKAKDYGIEVNDDYIKRGWKISESKNEFSGSNVVLSNEEINLLESLILPDNLSNIRDIFLLGIYTGQRYGDYQKINIDNVINKNGHKFIKLVQEKGQKLVEIPFNEKIKNILLKYGGYPPKFTEQYFNRQIKEVCQFAKLNEKVTEYTDFANSNKPVETIKEKWELITSHTARRTFCTNAILGGVPPALVMKISGHTNMDTFQKYIKMDFDTIQTQQAMLKFFS